MSKQEFAPLCGVDFERLVRREARQAPWTETELRRIRYSYELWATELRGKFHKALLAIEHPEETDAGATALGPPRSCLTGAVAPQPHRPEVAGITQPQRMGGGD